MSLSTTIFSPPGETFFIKIISTCILNFSHETIVHQGVQIAEQSPEESIKKSEDSVFNYHRLKLVFGLVIFEFNDAIKEGDGDRLHDLYKFVLLLYKANGKTKYSYVVFLYLVKIANILSERDAHCLKWNRFYNKYGTKGGNIPLDLRMEQLNKIVKTMWRALGANLNEQSAERIANTVEPLELILDAIDKDCSLQNTKGYRSPGKPETAVQQITNDLMQIEAFRLQEGRDGHPSFPVFQSNLLKKLDYRDLRSWMVRLMENWDSCFNY